MDSNIFDLVKDLIFNALNRLSKDFENLEKITVQIPKNPDHGHLATNAAMVAKSPIHKNPKEIAKTLQTFLNEDDIIHSVQIAGPGFLNITLELSIIQNSLLPIINNPNKYGHNPNNITKQSINLEFVSANPTGPLHIGHARNAIIGDSLARMLCAVGHSVDTEYYVNDHGSQIKHLADSVYYELAQLYRDELQQKYQSFVQEILIDEESEYDKQIQSLSEEETVQYLKSLYIEKILPYIEQQWSEKKSFLQYQGAYIAEVAKFIRDNHGYKYLITDYADIGAGIRIEGFVSPCLLPESSDNSNQLATYKNFVPLCVKEMLSGIENTLETLKVRFYKDNDHNTRNFFYESSLYKSQKHDTLSPFEKAIESLKEMELIYKGKLAKPPKGKTIEDWEPREQLLFKASNYGDDTDRPLQKSDNSWTYFASDIAYQYDKILRQYDKTILILGVDHAGYVTRMKAMSDALTKCMKKTTTMTIKLQNLVNLMRKGQPLKMSKRAGTFLSVDEVLQELDPDVFRFIMLTRKNDAILDFDIEKAKEQSMDNPIFYVQYAHARCHSVMKRIKQLFPDMNPAQSDLSLISGRKNLELILLLSSWPHKLQKASQELDPHSITVYLQDLSKLFHNIWSSSSIHPDLRFVYPDNENLTIAKYNLVYAVTIVIKNALSILGIEAVNSM